MRFTQVLGHEEEILGFQVTVAHLVLVHVVNSASANPLICLGMACFCPPNIFRVASQMVGSLARFRIKLYHSCIISMYTYIYLVYTCLY